MTVVKGGHLFRELGQIVLHIQHRIDQIVGLKGQAESVALWFPEHPESNVEASFDNPFCGKHNLEFCGSAVC